MNVVLPRNGFVCAKVLILTLVLIVLTLTIPASGRASTITVKQNGGGDFDTITAAIGSASPGDTIEVFNGTYEESIVIDKDLKLVGAGPQFVAIFNSLSHGIVVNSSKNATITGFTISSYKEGIYVLQGAQAVIKNNCIVGNGGNGICAACGVTVSAVNNVLSYNSGNGVYAAYDYGCVSTINVHSNIIVNNGSYGIYLDNSRISYNGSSNDVFSNKSGGYHYVAEGVNDKAVDPLFIDPTVGSYILKTGSPCINAGRTGAMDVDPDGTRNDMGAYGGPGAASFWPYPPGAPVITNLNVSPQSVSRGSTITITGTGMVR